MSWLQIKIKTTKEFAEELSEYLHEQGSLAVTFQDSGDEPLFEPPLNELVLWKDVLIIALFPHDTDVNAIVRPIAQMHGASLSYTVETLEDKDWDKMWMSTFKPTQFGKRLWILPSYHEVGDLPPYHVILDPGLAFGTGTHPTTALCLQWLDENLNPDMTVIDYGCGSGILSLAALKLGAKKVWAVDHDPQALRATVENAKRNNIPDEQLEVFLPQTLPNLTADLLLANILANPLIELAATFANLLRVGGTIVLSGILEQQTHDICAVYKKYFAIENIVQQDEWMRVVGQKK